MTQNIENPITMKNREHENIVIEVTNTHKTKPKKCVLFGGDLFLDSPNFGSDKEIKVSPINNSYTQILRSNQLDGCILDCVHFTLDKTVDEVSEKSVVFCRKNVFGKGLKKILSIERDPYQIQDSVCVLDIYSGFARDSFLELNIDANSTYMIRFYFEMNPITPENLVTKKVLKQTLNSFFDDIKETWSGYEVRKKRTGVFKRVFNWIKSKFKK